MKTLETLVDNLCNKMKEICKVEKEIIEIYEKMEQNLHDILEK